MLKRSHCQQTPTSMAPRTGLPTRISPLLRNGESCLVLLSTVSWLLRHQRQWLSMERSSWPRPTATTVLDEAGGDGGKKGKSLRGQSHPRNSGPVINAVTHCGCAASHSRALRRRRPPHRSAQNQTPRPEDRRCARSHRLLTPQCS